MASADEETGSSTSTIHMVAICQIRQTNSDEKTHFERKVAEEKTKREAFRSLKRHVSNAVDRQLLPTSRSRGPREQAGTVRSLRDRLCTLATGSPARSLRTHQTFGCRAIEGCLVRGGRKAAEMVHLTHRGLGRDRWRVASERRSIMRPQPAAVGTGRSASVVGYPVPVLTGVELFPEEG